MTMRKRLVPLFLFCLSSTVFAQNEKKGKKINYRASKRLDFQSLLIEGEKKKAQFSVVTGNLGETDFGLLRLRENFHDFMQDDIREEVQ